MSIHESSYIDDNVGFSSDSLPQNENIEMVDKQTISAPQKVKEKSKWAARFITEMEASIKNPNT